MIGRILEQCRTWIWPFKAMVSSFRATTKEPNYTGTTDNTSTTCGHLESTPGGAREGVESVQNQGTTNPGNIVWRSYLILWIDIISFLKNFYETGLWERMTQEQSCWFGTLQSARTCWVDAGPSADCLTTRDGCTQSRHIAGCFWRDSWRGGLDKNHCNVCLPWEGKLMVSLLKC